MERQLFDWKSWDCIDVGYLQFYNCTLEIDIGPYKAGEIHNCIGVSFDKGKLEFFDENGDIYYSCSLELKIKV